jgi:hypothetical protein
MITREEYNKALDIVEAYHKQLFIGGVSGSLRDLGKTEWTKWDKLNTDCSIRLRNIILANPDLYLEDITYNVFIRCRNSGEKTWKEFTELRGR